MKPVFSGLADSSSSPYSPSRTVIPLGDDNNKLKNSVSASRPHISNAQSSFGLSLRLYHSNNDQPHSSTPSPRIDLPPPLPIADISPVSLISSSTTELTTTTTTASSPTKNRKTAKSDDQQTTKTSEDPIQKGICSRLSSLPASAASQSFSSLISASSSNELSTPNNLRTRNGSSFPSQRQHSAPDAAPAATTTASTAASINEVRDDNDDVNYYRNHHHHGDVKDSREQKGNNSIAVSSSIDNERWQNKREGRLRGGGDLKYIPCVHRESSSVVDALHNLTSPIDAVDKYFRRENSKDDRVVDIVVVGDNEETDDDRTKGNRGEEIKSLTSQQRHQRPDSRPNGITNVSSLFPASPGAFADFFGISSSANAPSFPASEPRCGGVENGVLSFDAGILKSRTASQKQNSELPAVYLKMTSNRYKRTEFEEGDGESIGGSSLDSVGTTLPSSGVGSASSSGHHDHHGGGFKLFDPAVAFKSPHAWAGRRSPLEKILLVSLFVCVIVIIAISAALNSVRHNNYKDRKGGSGDEVVKGPILIQTGSCYKLSFFIIFCRLVIYYFIKIK